MHSSATHLERQLSSAGCSTSYSVTSHYNRVSRPTSRRGALDTRCTAQPSRPYHSLSSHDRDSARRHAHHAAGSVAASAAAVAPASPSSDPLRSLPADLITSIPDAIPSREDLEDLHSRAMRASRGRTGRTHAPPVGAARALSQPLQAGKRSGTPVPTTAPGDDASVASPEPPVPGPPSAERDPSYLDQQLSVLHFGPPAEADATGADERKLHLGQDSSGRGALPPTRPRPNLPPAGGRSSASRPPRKSPKERPKEQPVMQLTMAIKHVEDWRQLPGLLEETAPTGLDPFNAAAFLTHLAQRVAFSPPASPAEAQAVERMQAVALEVVGQNMHEYRARQVSNMTWALARLGLPAGATFIRERMHDAAYPLLPWYEPQHLSNTLWALATAGVSPEDDWLEEFLTAAFVVLKRRAFEAQHLSNVLWALERMGVMPEQEWMVAFYDCVAAAVPAANGQDCSNILSSLALMGMHEQLPAATAALAERLAARLQALLTDTGASSRGGAPSSVLTPMPMRAANGAEGAWTADSDDGEDGGEVSDQSIAMSIWALTVMGVAAAEELWPAVSEALRARLVDGARPAPGVHPAALSTVLWAATTAGRPLPVAVTAALYGRVRLPVMQAMEGRGLATMVWALATAPPGQARPPSAWVSDAIKASERCLPQLGPQAVSNLLYGITQLGVRPPPPWMSAVVNHFHRNLASEASAQSVSNVLWCLAKLGYRLNAEGLEILVGLVRSRLEAWQQQLQQLQLIQQQQAAQLQPAPPPFNAQEVSNVLYALASMGYAPEARGRTSQLLLAAARARLHEAKPQELSNTMWSLAMLQVRPPDDWLRDYYCAATARLPSFQPADLAQSLYAAAKLQLPLHTAVAAAANGAAAIPASDAPAKAVRGRKAAGGRKEVRGRKAAGGRKEVRGRKAAGGRKEVGGRRAVGGRKAAATVAVKASSRALGGGSGSASGATAWLSAAMGAAPRLVSVGSAQDLCDLSWALVQLGVPVAPDGPLATAFAARLVSLASACEPAQLALGVWALGKWRVRPSRVQAQQLEVATFRKAQSMRSHELAAMLSGFAGMSHTPPTEWLEDALQQITARSREFGPQDWTMVVSSLARVRDEAVIPQTEELVARLLPRMHRLPLLSLVLLAYSCGCMGPSPTCRSLVARCLTLLAGSGATAAAPAGGESVAAAAATGAAARPKAAVRRRGAKAERSAVPAAKEKEAGAGAAAQPGARPEAQGDARPVAVGSLSASELSALLWAAVRVGFKSLPPDFKSQFLSRTAPMLPDLPASLVASYLWAAGRLRVWLPGPWRAALVERAAAVLPAMRPQELVMCLSGLMWLRVCPSKALLCGLREAYATHGSHIREVLRMKAHAEAALRVLAKRRAAVQCLEQTFTSGVWWRRVWAARVKRGLERTATAAAEAQGKGFRSSRPKPEGYVTRRRSLRLGVLRRPPSRLEAARRAAAKQAAAQRALAAPAAQ